MKKAMFDFVCEQCGKAHERYCSPEIHDFACDCGGAARKVVQAPRFLRIDGTPCDIMSDKWAKTREINSKRNYDRTGKQ